MRPARRLPKPIPWATAALAAAVLAGCASPTRAPVSERGVTTPDAGPASVPDAAPGALPPAVAVPSPAPGQVATPGPGAAPPVPPSLPFGGLFGSGLSPALETQRARLAQALDGTPVVVEPTGDRRLRVQVPLKHAFDPGRAAVRPALAAVLDQLAIGFRPQAAVTELHVGIPGEEGSSAQLMQERGLSTRDYLVGRGVPISRVASVGPSASTAFEVIVSDRTPPAP